MSYGFLFVITFILIILTFEKVGEFRNTRRKIKLINIFKEYDSHKLSEKDNLFFDLYLSHGAGFIEYLLDLLKNKQLISDTVETNASLNAAYLRNFHYYRKSKIISELERGGIITINNGEINVDQSRYSVLSDFYSFLKRKGELKKSMFEFRNYKDIIEINGDE